MSLFESRGSVIRNPRGQSLVQVIVSIGIFAAMLMALVESQVMASKENRALAEKLAALDFQRSVSQLLSQPDNCKALFDPSNLLKSGSLPFNPANVKDAQHPLVISLKKLPMPGSAPPLAVAGEHVSALSSTLALLPSVGSSSDGIQLEITNASPIMANLALNFDQGNLVRAIKNLKLPLSLVTAPAGANVAITGCTTNGVGSVATISILSDDQSCGGGCAGGVCMVNCPNEPANVTATCPSGYIVSGCGYQLVQWAPVMNDNASPPNFSSMFHTNAPDHSVMSGNGCSVWAGGAPGCGVCFKAQAICIKSQF